MEWKKGLISGLVAGIVMIIVGSLFMFIPATSEWYRTTFPQMVTASAMGAMLASTIVTGLVMGMVYSLIRGAIPGEGTRKGVVYGLIVWFLAGLMWPIMMMGFAPIHIWVIELISGLVVYLIAGIVLVAVYEKMS
jgi:hypothetical protein